MTDEKKLYAQLVWNSALETTKKTFEVADEVSAIKFAVDNYASYFTTYQATQPDDALANSGPRIYTLALDGELQTARQIIDALESDKNTPHMRDFNAPVLGRMFSTVSRDGRLQAQFSAAAAKPDNTEKFNAIIDLLRAEKPDQAFVVQSSGGYIKMEEGDKVYAAGLKRVYPAGPK